MNSEQVSTGALADNLQATADSYDALPYDDTPIFRTHPSRIAAVAKMFGLDAPPIRTARVLELGCAAGSNIIPLAFFYPEAKFLGIELSQTQIENGWRRIEALGLTNVELRCESITDLDMSDGPFDYIICHGVYSWVPAEVRQAILRICRAMLSSDGIAYISYNVLPGWRTYQPVRDALRLMVPREADAATRAAMGRRLVRLMGEETPDKGAYGLQLRESFELLSRYSNSYLFHEYMEPVNEPVAFGEFVDEAAENGLAYLAECELRMMFGEPHGSDFAEMLDKITDNNIVTHQQMLDILTGQTFRTSLLVRGERADRIERKVSADVLRQLHYTPAIGFTFQRFDGGYVITSKSGEERTFDDPLFVTIIENLLAAGQATASFDDCLEAVGNEQNEEAISLIWQMLMFGLISASLEPLCSGRIGNGLPIVTRLVRCDAAIGCETSASRLHQGIGFGDLPTFLLKFLDGSNDRAALLAAVEAAIEAGEITKPAEMEAGSLNPEHVLETCLRAIADYGLIEE